MRRALPPKQCRNCGGYFMPKRKIQVFCSDVCREAYYDEHVFRKITTSKICPNCGGEFTTSKPFLQTYCSEECRKEARFFRDCGKESKFMGKAVQSMLKIVKEHPEGPRGHKESLELKEKLRQRGYKLTPALKLTLSEKTGIRQDK